MLGIKEIVKKIKQRSCKEMLLIIIITTDFVFIRTVVRFLSGLFRINELEKLCF